MSEDAALTTLRGYLTDPRFEVLPLRGVLERASALPYGSTVTVTASPTKGVAATVDTAIQLSAMGLRVVPHLAARLVTDRAELAGLLDRLADHGLSEVFVIAGDTAPAGEFTDALSLLRAISAHDRPPARIGITGYPERHAFIPDADTIAAMTEKSRYAHYIVSQICYDPFTIESWVKAVRARGVMLPIHLGIPGAVDAAKLLRISMRIGLGDSMRFLRKQHGVVGKLLAGYNPDGLVGELSPVILDPANRIAGWHLFTFNEIAKTWQWSQTAAKRLEGVPA